MSRTGAPAWPPTSTVERSTASSERIPRAQHNGRRGPRPFADTRVDRGTTRAGRALRHTRRGPDRFDAAPGRGAGALIIAACVRRMRRYAARRRAPTRPPGSTRRRARDVRRPPPGRRRVPSPASPSRLLRVLARAEPIDDNHRLVADDPRIMAARQRGHVTGTRYELGSVVHRDRELTGDVILEMWRLATRRLGDRLHVL